MVEFQDYESGGTPLSAYNLNKLQTDLKSTIDSNYTELNNKINDDYYYPGDKVNAFPVATGGYLTSGSKELSFQITVGKSMKNISNISISEGLFHLRHVGGGYLEQGSSYSSMKSSGTFKITKVNNYTIIIDYIKTNAYSATNNTPIGVQITGLSLSFN